MPILRPQHWLKNPHTLPRLPKQEGSTVFLILTISIPLLFFWGLMLDGARAYLGQERLRKAFVVAAAAAEETHKASRSFSDAKERLEAVFGQYYRQDDDPLTPPIVPQIKAEQGRVWALVSNPMPGLFTPIIGAPTLNLKAAANWDVPSAETP